jgi:putative membrane protein
MAAPAIDLGWEWDPWVVLPLAASLLLYARGLARLWFRAGLGRGVSLWQACAFAIGWLVLLAALVSPLHEYGEHLFFAHMIEHELLMTVAAPLLAAARPLGTFLHGLPVGGRRLLTAIGHSLPVRIGWRWIMSPLYATLLHAVAIWLWHIPALLDGTLVSETLHRAQHISFLGTALVFWWALLRRPPRDYGLAALHVFATMVHTGLLGALITLAPQVLYPQQTNDAPQFGLTALEDQQLAGLIMWVPGGIFYLAAGLALAGFWLFSARPRPSLAARMILSRPEHQPDLMFDTRSAERRFRALSP